MTKPKVLEGTPKFAPILAPKKFDYSKASLHEMQQENQRRMMLLAQQGLVLQALDYHYMCALLETLLGDELDDARKRYESTVGALLDKADEESARAKLLQGVQLPAGFDPKTLGLPSGVSTGG